uniref:ATP-binding cassette sub-family A member 5-like n=1 Tax=Saccoglossus kowalevskii TaxID=10224 RepID=A0ABM0M9Y8_SACKO|nr:PREDICTED: ATP-binding cassette sub-family A member 5-like [Saccoglossus kowalevskii]
MAYWSLNPVWLLVIESGMAYWSLDPVWPIGYWIQYGLLVIGSSMAYWLLDPVWPIGYWIQYGLLVIESIVTVSFMMTPFFNKALVAGGVASISSLFMSLLYLPFALTSALPVQLQVVLSFLSPFTMAMAIDKVTKLESVDNGVQFDNIWSAREGELSFAYALIILSVDIVLYLVLAVYFDNVIPGEYGQRKPIFFCFMPSYWKRRETRVDTECTSFLTASVNSIHAEIEPVSAGLQSKVGIRISNLVKVFKSGDKGKDVHAIDGISLDIYEGEITCLLGHNGAGKTTLINALNGMVPPTSGGASIYGLDVTNANDMTHIRSITGICLQQNVILDALTASEHLRVFAGLKGIPPEKIEQEVEKILKDCDLSKCSDKHAKSLSGGQKRKLCVGMALIGDPKILFLDEPSSGMDPYSRRHLWSLLKNNREGRVIVLTTHFMDEADILADRKAIISKGKLRCYGTSLFLKSKFGIGYHLGMYIGEDCDPEKVTAYVQSYIPNAELGRLYGMELTYTLPLHDVGLFAKLFTALDTVNEETGLSVSHSMGINSYGIAMTTLEEVFLKLGDEAESDESMQAAAAPLADYGSLTQKANEDGSYDNKAVSRDLSISMTVNGQDSIDAVDFKPAPLQASQVTTRTLKAGRHQFTALMHVRIKLTIRNARTYILRILFPILFMIGGIALVQFINITTDDRTDPAPLVVQPSLYLRAPQEGPSHKTELLYNNDTGNDLTSLSSQFDRLNIEHRLDNLTDLLFQTEKHNLAANIHQWDEINQDVISKYTAMYNDSAVHSIPTILNTMTNVLYGIVSSNDDVFITTYKPFPEDDKALGFNMGMFFALFFGFALITIPNGFAVDIVKDRQFKTKSQLRVSGVRMQKYWLVYLMVGLVQYSIPAITGVILVVIFRVDNFLIPGAMLCMIILLILYLPIATIFQFCTSFMFDKYDTAQSALPWLSYFVPFVFLGPVIALDLLGNYEIAALMSCIFVLLCPVYAIFAGLYYIDRVYEVALVFHGVDNLDVGDYFKFDSYITPTFLKGNSAPKMTFNPDVFTDEEDDVKSERDKVNELSSIRNISDIEAVPVISIKNLRKTFEESKSEGCCQRKKQENEKQSKVAVRNLSLAIHKSEIFGLLGPNGAGKTTTMNMIIADIAPDCGSVYVIGQEIDSPISEAFLLMGYCPQMDPLWEELTTREHLETYAAIKGVHKHDLKQTAHYFLDALKIQEHADKKTKALSGGTKRKLCFAMSMLGEPQVVLMDEPSTGMDPAAKRFLWYVLN